MTRYPRIIVRLPRKNQNRLETVKRVMVALRQAKVSRDDLVTFYCNAMTAEASEVIDVCRNWVTVRVTPTFASDLQLFQREMARLMNALIADRHSEFPVLVSRHSKRSIKHNF